MLFDRNDDDEYNFYDSEDILNEAYDNEYDFYDTEYDTSSDFKNTPDLKVDNRSKNLNSKFVVPPPLPLCHFEREFVGVSEARTITGRIIRHIDHNSRHAGLEKDGLHNPMICRFAVQYYSSDFLLEHYSHFSLLVLTIESEYPGSLSEKRRKQLNQIRSFKLKITLLTGTVVLIQVQYIRMKFLRVFRSPANVRLRWTMSLIHQMRSRSWKMITPLELTLYLTLLEWQVPVLLDLTGRRLIRPQIQ
jgi:hypothetical protein